ncbi:MAG TPA: ferredoxin [Amycolatopsis sp.]|nr:ferredoxin [Amycolatopsis sp.]
MKISVDSMACEAHGQCAVVDAELFPLDDEGYSTVGEDREVPPGREDIARSGVAACPLAALRISEE